VRVKFFSLTVVLSLALTAPVAGQSAGSLPVRFLYLKAVTPGENSALSADCNGTTSTPEITCRFTQLMVSYKLDPKTLPQELEKRLSQVRSEVAKNPKKAADEMCGDIRKSRAEFEQKMSDLTNARTKAAVQDLLSLCANPSLEAFEGFVRRSTIAESKTCKVSVFQNDPITFKRTSPGKWVANVGPQGVCKAVYLYTMEHDQKHTSLWKWSQVRTYADTSGEFCKDKQVNYKLEYSWRGDDPDMNCESISFGS
jgi:hypothetical protein